MSAPFSRLDDGITRRKVRLKRTCGRVRDAASSLSVMGGTRCFHTPPPNAPVASVPLMAAGLPKTGAVDAVAAADEEGDDDEGAASHVLINGDCEFGFTVGSCWFIDPAMTITSPDFIGNRSVG